MPSPLQHRRSHNLLLLSKILSHPREGVAASPFTLVLDSLAQGRGGGRSLVGEIVGRCKASKTRVVFISFETVRRWKDVDVFIQAWGKDVDALEKEIHAAVEQQRSSRTLLIIDTLNPLATTSPALLPHFLSSLITPSVSVLATYHLDIPICSLPPTDHYIPPPLQTLKYLATTLLTPHSLPRVLARKAARERSVAEPVWGLEEGREGVIVGLDGGGVGESVGAGGDLGQGVVLEMEHRRKSGRGVREVFFVPLSPPPTPSHTTSTSSSPSSTKKSPKSREPILLDDHPLYNSSPPFPTSSSSLTTTANDPAPATFNLSLTEKQRRDREGVVLPYFDAQDEMGGGGEGGRILYEMGREDDFDEEEDEI
ncbi:hypothetical protein K402DRAFT_451744 [Aulographum hederae CBS 113979]|uniref:Elongator complex protein 5 n=1 Tax=Aulographum hederae CBS 113979 TaxID=1176131 RepID=A0A6G1HAU8_9PEZI|nr:hypothetical protein K402DRAFT_451744 [Aulographum hederae CBS 113979]